MSKETLIERLDVLLKPLGFSRQKALWNRRVGQAIEVIELQVSKAQDTVTVNAGILDTEAYGKLWGSEPPARVEVPVCTVGVRVGELIDDKDLWWPIDDDQVSETVAQSVSDHVLPFMARMRSRGDMLQWLTDTQVVKRKYPPPIIYLAILQNLLGRPSEACALLAEVARTAIGGWRVRAVEVAARLGCPS